MANTSNVREYEQRDWRVDEGAECSPGSCLGSFGCLQEFLEGSWVKRSEKQRFSCEEEKRG